MKLNFSVRLIESLVAFHRVSEADVKMDVREVILRYVTNSKVTTNRIIYYLISRGYLKTRIDHEILSAVKDSLLKLKRRKGPYIGFAIASAVEKVVDKYDHIDWHLTEKGRKYLGRKLSELGMSLATIKRMGESPLTAVTNVRRKIQLRFSELTKQKLLLPKISVEVSDFDAARIFVVQAHSILYPESSRKIEPKAGFAISFARDEDAVAESLVRERLNNKTLWKLLNTEYVNPLVTNYRNYLIMYAVSMLYPESYSGIARFIKNATNWPKLAEEGRAESLDSYMKSCIRSGYVVDRSGVLEFADPFIVHRSSPRSVIEYLNDIYFASTILATSSLAFSKTGNSLSYTLNFKKAVSCMAATLLWQSAYSYPIPIVRKNDQIDCREWCKELKGLSSSVKKDLTFPMVMDKLNEAIAIKVLEKYVSDFIKLLLKGGVVNAIKDPEGGCEVLIPHGIAIKLFNIFRGEKNKGTHISTLVCALKRLLSEKGHEEPLIRRERLLEVFRKEFGVNAEPILYKLRNEGVIVEVGEHYILTPYDLPAVYLDLLKGPSSIVHAQSFAPNFLHIVSMVNKGVKERLQELLSELESKKSVPFKDFSDVSWFLIEVIQLLKGWGVIEIDVRNGLLRLSDDFKLDDTYDAKFIVRALREILGWKVYVEDLSASEAKKELEEHIEGKDVHEMFDSIGQLSRVAEPPYEKIENEDYEKGID